VTLEFAVNLASLISSIAVLVSVVYLALQVRQGALNQRSTMDRGRSQQVGEWLQHTSAPETAELMLRGHAGDGTLTALEIHRYLWSIYPLILHFEDSYYQHRAGMISDAQYASIVGHLRSRCPSPGFRAIWQHIRLRFRADFCAFIDGLMRESPPETPESSDWTTRWRADAAAEMTRAVTRDAADGAR
jgi:hypothetical protein